MATLSSRPAVIELGDAELVALLRRGDPDAITAIYARYATPLLRLTHRLLGALDDAEDVVQDVFVGLNLALRQYDERGSFAAWLKRVTVRTALMHRRGAARRRLAPLAASDSQGRASAPEPVLERMTLDAAIATLPEGLRDVFVLYHIDHFSHGEIAEALGIRRGTSEVRLHRAVRQLRAYLENDQ